MPWVVVAETMRIPIFELSFIYELGGDEQALPFSSRQGWDLVTYGSIIDDVILVDDKGLVAVDEVLIDICADYYRCCLDRWIFDVEKAIPEGSIFTHIAVEI